MARAKADYNNSILEYALHHLERERDEIQVKIDHIVRQLGRRPTSIPKPAEAPGGSGSVTPGKTRVLSDAARKRIAAAQKRRWAEHRRAKAKAQ
jgi:hypothetical protein